LPARALTEPVLIGVDLDQIRDFWGDNGLPYDESRCRDRLAAIIGPELMRYDVQCITEADMPNTKRADLAIARGAMQLPMEVAGTPPRSSWTSNTLIDWRSEQRGIYCVLWFGDLPRVTMGRPKAERPLLSLTERKQIGGSPPIADGPVLGSLSVTHGQD
jgi:hypothetical protein